MSIRYLLPVIFLIFFGQTFSQVTIDTTRIVSPAPQQSSHAGAVLGPDIRLTNNAAESVNPRAVVDASYLYVTWKDSRDGNDEIYWQKFNRGNGAPATSPIRVTNTAAASVQPAIGIDAFGNSYLAWREGANLASIWAAKLDPNGAFEVSPMIALSGAFQNPDIAVGASGDNVIVAHIYSGINQNVYERRGNASLGSICSSSLYGSAMTATKYPAVAFDGATAYTSYQEWELFYRMYTYSSSATCASSKVFQIDPGNSFVPCTDFGMSGLWVGYGMGGNVYNLLASNNSAQVNDVSGTAGVPRVAASSPNAYFVWHDSRNGNADIYVSEASKPTQAFTDIRVTDNAASQQNPDIACPPSEAGKWWVVWQDYRDGNWEIYFNGNELIPPQPHIMVEPTALSFQAQYQAALPVSQTITITNSGPDILDWAVSKPVEATWLVIDEPSSGSGNNATVTIRVTTTNLDPGTYSTTLTVSSSNADNSPVTVAVTYQIDFGLIDPIVAQQKQDIIDYFNGVPFYSTAESKAQTFVNLVSSHIASGSVTQEELEAMLRLLAMEEAAKAAYWTSAEANVPAIAQLTARSMENAAFEILLDRMFSYIGKHFERLKDSRFLGWFYNFIMRIKEYFSSALKSHNGALVSSVANKLIPHFRDIFGVSRSAAQKLATEYAWNVATAAGEELYAVPFDRLQEEMLIDPVANAHVRAYENGIWGVGGTQGIVTGAVTAAELGQFQVGQGQAVAANIRNVQVPQIELDNTSCVKAMNGLVTVAELISLAQLYSLVAGLILAAIAVLAGVALCTAFAVGCVFGAIAGFIAWGVIAQIQTALTWVKIGMYLVAATTGWIELYGVLPHHLNNAQHTAFEGVQTVQMLAAESVAEMPRFRIPDQWTDSLALASVDAANRLTIIRNDIAAGEWDSALNRFDGLDTSLQRLTEMTSVAGSIVGNTYLTNRTDSTSSADSAMNRAMAHAESANMSLGLAQMALAFGAASQPDGPNRDSLLLTIDSAIARLQAMPPAFDSTLTQFADLGFTAPALVVVTSASMVSSDTNGLFRATIRNVSDVPVHDIDVHLSVVDSTAVTINVTGDTLLALLSPGAEQILEWGVLRQSTDTLFQLELRVIPRSLPGDFIGDSKMIGLNIPFGVPCCVGTAGNVDMSGIVDLSDLSAIVSYLSGSGYTLTCPDEANANGAGIVDLSDLSALVSYLTGGGYVLPNCP